MGVSDGNVNWPLFFGCLLTAFGPIAALFFIFVAKRAQLVIISLSAAFTWMVSILLTATIWQIISPMQSVLGATIPVAVVIQELARFGLFCGYRRTENAVAKVTRSADKVPLNDLTSSIAAGVGWAIMHSCMMYGSMVGSSTGYRGAAFYDSCESMPAIFVSAFSTLALTGMDVSLMIISFEAFRKNSIALIAAVIVIHAGVALSSLANESTNGCYISVPVHYGGLVISSALAVVTAKRSSYHITTK